MHYDTFYEGLTPQAKHAKAIADCKEYLGVAKYYDLLCALRQEPPQSIGRLRMWLSLVGIAGYPVRAMHDEAWPYG